MAHPLTEKRIAKQRELEREVRNLAAWMPKRSQESDAVQRQFGIIGQKIQFLVEAAIYEGMGDDA